MKLLILTIKWAELIAHSLRRLPNIEVIEYKIPLSPIYERDRYRIAREIVDTALREEVALVLDFTGIGILPMDETFKSWTPLEVGVPWCEWWADSPYISARGMKADSELDAWFSAMCAPNVLQFTWDRHLARELTIWFGFEWRYLPLASNTALYFPEAAKHASREFPPVDVTFLGTYYPILTDTLTGDAAKEIEFLVEQRFLNQNWNLFDVLRENSSRLPLFAAMIADTKMGSKDIFSKESSWWQDNVNVRLGWKRRSENILKIPEYFDSYYVHCQNQPPEISKPCDAVYFPPDLVACYRSAMFNLDLQDNLSCDGISMRVYDVLASGGVLARSAFPDFDPKGDLAGTVYVKFDDFDHLRELRDYYRDKKNELLEIGANAAEFIRMNHDWPHRFAELIEVVAEYYRSGS